MDWTSVWWTVAVPHRRQEPAADGEHEVPGVQWFEIRALNAQDAIDEARAELLSPASVRHRRGARADIAAATAQVSDRQT
ncbi:hypothetical protein [Streptomyces sp. NRRL S-495]|uniref:hypothetical protein n=1 Tax=Streptomyces sp. NRRL S-495 TaxID=1609133 RepID=UPI0005F8A062|nr:hypothetical protein [Streptomyces sp. NRRL S-495]KJY32140.1 hypothetical protein VR45_23265 [Streptomyces sp. NRRL S-495]